MAQLQSNVIVVINLGISVYPCCLTYFWQYSLDESHDAFEICNVNLENQADQKKSAQKIKKPARI